MNKVVLYIIFSIPIFCFLSCGKSEKPAGGSEDEIYVVADSIEFAAVSMVLDSTFEKIICTPQPEKLFTLIRINPEQLDSYKTKKNILIVAPLNSNSVTSHFIHSSIDDAELEKVKNDNTFMIKKENLWAGGQLVMFLTAPSVQQLQSDILKSKDNLLFAYQKASDERLKSCLYNPKYENESLEGKLLKKYGWIIYIPSDYKLALDIPKDNFVWLRRSPGDDMERWLFVHWIDHASPAFLNEDSINTIRNRVTRKYYRTVDDSAFVKIASDYYMPNEVNFKGRYAIFTQGLWEMSTKKMDGPFINYTFFDEKTDRLYMIDGSVFAPKYYKRNLIQQMDVLLQSFMTENQIKKDKKEDLLSASENVNNK